LTSTDSILFYDGDCGLCHAAVRWILRHDHRGTIRFAPLQGMTYAALSLPNKPTDLTTVVFLDEDELLVRGDAVIRFLKRMGGIWALFGAVGVIVPRLLRDASYRFVADRRIRWFGRAEACALPNPVERNRFLP